MTCFLVFLAPVSATLGHPFHTSQGEADWNPETGCLEVALRLNPQDLELAINPLTRPSISLEDASAEARVAEYVRQSFEVEFESSERPAPIEWIGMEVDAKSAWLFFEVPSTRAPTEIPRISNRLLMDTTIRQQNCLTVRLGEIVETFIFTAAKPWNRPAKSAELPQE